MIRSVLCYGDSNTFGSATVDRPDGRYGPDERWPGVLRNALGSGWLVIEEGLGGRTTVSDDPVEGADKNGRSYLYPCLRSHRPLDVVVIMLGTNDLKNRFGKTAWDIAEGVGVLVSIVKTSGAGRNEGVPEIIIISPPPMLRELPMHAEMFVGGYEKSLTMASLLQGGRRAPRRALLRCRQRHDIEQGRRLPLRSGRSPVTWHGRRGGNREDRVRGVAG